MAIFGLLPFEFSLLILISFSAHQTHYEQFGKIEGTFDIEGIGEKTLSLSGVRDHSYGK